MVRLRFDSHDSAWGNRILCQGGEKCFADHKTITFNTMLIQIHPGSDQVSQIVFY